MVQIPQNIQVELELNSAVIRFSKAEGAMRTEIDRFWVNGEETYDDYTTGNSFYYNNLEWGKTYQFKLRSFYPTGEIAETDVISFTIESAIVPTPASNVVVSVEKNVVQINFTKGAGVRTYIIKSWDEKPDYTTGNGFYLENLPWGLNGEFVLVSESNTGETAESDTYTFKIEDEIIPTAPSNVVVSTYKNNAEIRFTKGAGIKTLLDKFWVNGEGTFDEYTRTDTVFYLDNLDWGKTYEFRLRTEGNTGLVADTEVISFAIEDEIIPTVATNIKASLFKNNAEISFIKGNADRTYLGVRKAGESDFDFSRYTKTDSVFYLNDLEWGSHYEYVLRSMGNSGKYVDTAIQSFDIEPIIGPTLPTSVNISVDANTVAITMAGQEGIRIEIAKSWDGGLTSFSEYTTGNGFFFDGLPWGLHGEFVLRAVSNTGATATSEVYSFDIVESPAPIAPSNITQLIGDGDLTIKFTKGNGVRTQIDCSWVNGLGSWDYYTTGNAFYFEKVPANSKLQYRLRTVSVSGETAESELKTIYTPIW